MWIRMWIRSIIWNHTISVLMLSRRKNFFDKQFKMYRMITLQNCILGLRLFSYDCSTTLKEKHSSLSNDREGDRFERKRSEKEVNGIYFIRSEYEIILHDQCEYTMQWAHEHMIHDTTWISHRHCNRLTNLNR